MNIPLDKFRSYLKNKNLKERTIQNYLFYCNKFIYPFFNQETVSRFLSLPENDTGNARYFVVNFKEFLKFNYQELGLSPEQRTQVLEVEVPKTTGRLKERIIKPLTQSEVELLEKQFSDEKERLELNLSYWCGLRLGELLKIKLISFNWSVWGEKVKSNDGEMGECRVFGKGDKEGIALVPSWLMKRIARYSKANANSFSNGMDSYLFLNQKRTDVKSENIKSLGSSWQKKLRAAGIKSGITLMDGKNKPIQETVVHPHRLRHSYGTYLLLQKGLDIREIQEILRHSSIVSTQIYTHINKEELKKKLE